MSLEDWLGRPGLASGLGCQIHVRLPGGRRLTFESDRRTLTIGRGAAADVRLQHPAVGARHLVVHHRDDGFAVTDQGAPTGTRASGQRLEPHATVPLADGEVVEIGPIEITFEEVVEAIVVDDGPADGAATKRAEPGLAAAPGDGRLPAPRRLESGRRPPPSVWTLRPEMLQRPDRSVPDGIERRGASVPPAGLLTAITFLRRGGRRRVSGRAISSRLAVHWPLLLQVAAATAVFGALALLVAIVLL